MDELLEYQKNSILGNIGGQPLCQEFKSAWRKCGNDKAMLVRLALSQQSIPHLSTACYKKLGVTKEYILRNFSEYINGNMTFDDVEGVNGYTYQMYAGFKDDFYISADVTTMMWCDCGITIQETKCPRLYVSNRSDVHITLDGYNSPVVYLFDESRISVDDADDTCELTVFKYSKDAKVEIDRFCFGKVNVFEKQLKI